MICNFPTPYPDELLYSLCARYSDRMQYPIVKAVSIDLFGHRVVSKVSFPNCLGYLAANIPPKQNYDVLTLINNHTLIPFYEPFLPLKLICLLKERMEADEVRPIRELVGFRHRISPGGCTRFCLRCVEEDRKQFGECYWHRVHQIPYIDVCPYHNLYLYDGNLYRNKISSSYEFISAEKMINNILDILPETIHNACDEPFRIALDALWLLENHPTENLQMLQKRYLICLANNNWSTYAGRVQTSKLQQAFQQHYNHAMLKQIHCEIDGSAKNWLAQLPHNETKCFHPVRHLLFIHFLGYTIETFLTLPTEKRPFGSGPWPCLNPICPHYRENFIRNCEIIYIHGTDGRPRGKFSCECGFTYSRRGPDLSDADRFRASAVKVYGPLWEARLRELLEKPAMSQERVALAMSVDVGTVRRQIRKLGLLSSQASNQIMPSKVARKACSIHPVEEINPVVREQYRGSWLSAREENPDKGIMFLQSNVPLVYRWLYSHDREWLRNHKPMLTKKSLPPRFHANWEERDIQFAAEVKLVALRIKDTEDYPVRMTKNIIINNTIHRHIVYSNLNNLPLTTQILAEYAETHEEFALRRVQWWKNFYLKESSCPTRKEFIKKGSFGKTQVLWSSVKEAIYDALRTLRSDKE